METFKPIRLLIVISYVILLSQRTLIHCVHHVHYIILSLNCQRDAT